MPLCFLIIGWPEDMKKDVYVKNNHAVLGFVRNDNLCEKEKCWWCCSRS